MVKECLFCKEMVAYNPDAEGCTARSIGNTYICEGCLKEFKENLETL